MSFLLFRVKIDCSFKRVLNLAVDLAYAVLRQLSNETLAALSHYFFVLLPQLFNNGVLTAHGKVATRAHTVNALRRTHSIILRTVLGGVPRSLAGRVNHLHFPDHFWNLGLGIFHALASVISPFLDSSRAHLDDFFEVELD